MNLSPEHKAHLTFLAVCIAGATAFYFRHNIATVSQPLVNRARTAVGDIVAKGTSATHDLVEKTISAPSPLRGSLAPKEVTLTAPGTIAETNTQRAQNGLPALTFNAKLAAAAQAKVADMFAKQYFEHESPTGVGPGDLADTVGYAYIAVGENLALGNFDDDADLVQAWMDSPGHRANILNDGYREIGVAVGKGVFEGHTTWLAVQEFGRPASDCPALNASLSAQIDDAKALLEQTKTALDAELAELDAMRPKSGPEYNKKVREYNDLVDSYNSLIKKTKELVATYNEQVRAYNACVEN
jgi:uncharacterized protein YkwD